ncbi:outer membrane receptor protein involved in Fe transport [Sphingopyxis panaciterrae]|nr:outer membrane receptor protein involved in Fe transport [Sphingopyxis panaciterrae]
MTGMFAGGRLNGRVLGQVSPRRAAMLALLTSAALIGTITDAAAQEAREGAENTDIIVTATRRETTLQETPAAVSVLGSDAIEKRKLVGMEDYLAALPGVSFADRGAGQNTITIRGIGQGDQLSANTPVGSYFGEVPVTGLGPPLNGNGAGNSDLKMVDISRVEVLRGPQGTLYGSGSMGGTVRVIPNAPNLRDVEGSLSAGYSHTGRSGSHNYSVEGVVNAPLVEDRLAVRLVAYRMFNDGYINNTAASDPTPEVEDAVAIGAVARDDKHAGSEKITGVRGSILWRPVDDLSITLTHAYQALRQDGFREVQLDLPGAYQQARVRVGENGGRNGYVNMDLNVSNLVVEYDAGFGSFLNSTSLIKSHGENDIDFSFFGFADPTLLAVSSVTEADKQLFVNEFRFASKFEGPFQLIAGLYYEDRETKANAFTRYTGTDNPPPAGAPRETTRNKNKQKQFAAFGEASLTPIDPLTLTVGGRYYKFEQDILIARVDDAPTTAEGRSATTDGFLWKANASYKASDDVFLYAQWAQGFRQPQFQRAILPQDDVDNDGLVEFADGIERAVNPGLLAPDKVDTYEVGVKFQSPDGRLRSSLTGFYTDWTGIPVSPALSLARGEAFYFNAGKAISKGVEFEVFGEVGDRLFAEFSTSWVKSTLDETVPGLGNKGTNLPGSADHNVKAALEKRFDLGENEAYIRGDYTYVGGYYTNFTETGLKSGDYNLFDVSAGVTVNNFKIGIYAKNLSNRKDFTWVDNIFGAAAGRAYRLRPRTIGVNVGVNF